MTSDWEQFLAAALAAVIPVVVKLLNDWHDRLSAATPKPAEGSGERPSEGVK